MNDRGPGAQRPDAGRNGGSGFRNELSGRVGGSAVQVQSLHGDLYFGAPPTRMPVPGQLPSPSANFTGRSRELALLQRIVADQETTGRTALVVLAGVGGAGKSSLASYALHQLRGRYRGGQLFAGLAAFGPGGPARPGDVLGWFLRSLGIAPERVPAGLGEQAALFRSLTCGGGFIILLDDAASAAQVRALLPGPGRSLVVVTTRRRLSGLAIDGAVFLDLGPLDEADAVELLGRIVGAARATSEPDQARRVVQLCGRLPLAVCVSGARLAPRPRWPIGRMAEELAGERRRLAALSIAGDISVRAAFEVSYQALPAEAARAYRLLALLPGPSFGPDLAAAATGGDPAQMGALLDTLFEASLLEETGERRFRFHDLVRLHARELASTEPEAKQQAVIRRSVAWYLDAAVAADIVVIPGRWRLNPAYKQPRRAAAGFGSAAAALDWLESELDGLVGAVRAGFDSGLHEQVWQLCEALWGLFAYRKHFPIWIDCHLLGVASAQACRNPRAEARMRVQLGLAHRQLGRHGQARGEFAKALALDRRERHRIGEATALEQLGLTHLSCGRPTQAVAAFMRAREVLRQLGRTRGVAMMLCHLGEAHRDLGNHDQAASFLGEARRLSAAISDRYNEARALTGLGQTRIRAGEPAGAVAPLTEALAIMGSVGSRYEQARIHTALADATRRLGDTGQARRHLEQALAIYNELGAPEAAEVRRRRDTLSPGSAPSALTRKHQDSPPP